MLDVFFDGSGVGEAYGGAGPNLFLFNIDSWNDVKVRVDLDEDLGMLYINDALVLTYVFSEGFFGSTISTSSFISW